jgi:eukaryotic-like serine/threonine-protein kinase
MSEQRFDQSSWNIDNIESNEGHIGNVYGDVNNEYHKHIYNNEPVVEPFVRKTLLERVHKAWIKGFLEPSLKGATFIPLGLYERPGLIEDPWKDIRQEAERSEGPLPDGTSIADVYDESEGALLILGEPGSGKTTLLLQLVHTLLKRASRNPTHPMPVVFNLSSWTLKRQPIAEWLAEELNTRYQMPQKMGKVWVAKGQILPLLDGLDEVAADSRGACISAINAYQKQQGQVPLIVGSRVAEYRAEPTKLAVRRAVISQPLSDQQVREYLEKADGHFEVIQRLLRDDPGFREFARNPLMLSILKQTYQGKAVQLARSDSIEEQRRQIFVDYVERMLRRRGRIIHYSSEQTEYWLIWLAKQMKQRNQTVFYIEGLQIDWLEKSRPVEISTSVAFGLLSFPVALTVYGLEYTIYGLRFAIVNGILAALLATIIAFFFVWSIETGFRVGNLFPGVKRKRPVHTAAEKSEKRTKLAAFFSPLFWERASFALFSGLILGLLIEFLVGPLYALINGLFLAAFLIVLGKFERKIQPAEKLVWTGNSLRKHAVGSLLIGVGIGVFGGIFDAAPYLQQVSVFLTTLSFWLSLGVALGIIIMLMRGFTSSELDKRQKDIKPNQGIRNSLSNSLRLGLSSGVLVGVVIFFFYSYVMHNVFRVGYINDIPANSDVIYGVGDAAAVTYLFWLINGGFATVQHLMLRIRLWQTGSMSWRYVRFLDYAHERILLRRVGGGYMFVHKLLLDYFASLDMIEGAYKITEESKQSEAISPTSEMPDDIQDESREEPTAPLILVPVLSDVPRLLPCGHEQRDPNARFCSICGRPVPPESLKE